MTTQYAKSIKYNRDTKDYDLLLDDEYVGTARTHHEGEVKLDAIVYNLLHGQPITDTCPSCGDVLHGGERLCAACVPADVIAALPVFRCPTCGGEGDCPDCSPTVVGPDLAQDMYNVICLTLSGAAATTAISELRRVQTRYEAEPKANIVGYIITDNQLHIHYTPKNGFHFSSDEGAYLFMTKKTADEHCKVLGGYVKALYS